MKILIYLLFLFWSCHLFGQQGVSVTASLKTYWGIAGIDYGLSFAVVSMETNVIYHSEVVSIFKQRHSVIKKLPPGTYRILYFGHSQISETLNNPLHEFFGIVELKKGESYYLGSFIGKRKVGRDVPIIYTIKDTSVPKKLTESLRRKEIIKKDEELIKLYPYNADTLIIMP